MVDFRKSEIFVRPVIVYNRLETGSRTPHRVPVYGEQNGRFLIHDPWTETDALETESAAAARPVLVLVPKEAFDRTARWAAAKMGDGLYGVDLKQSADGVFVIEINDNPNLDTNVEGAALDDALWRRLLVWFPERLGAK